MKTLWLLSLAGLVLGATLSTAACGDDDDDTPNNPAGKAGAAGSSGASGRGGSGSGGTGGGAAGAGNGGGGASGASGGTGAGAGGGGAGGGAGQGGNAGAGAGGAGGTAGVDNGGGAGAPALSFATDVLPNLGSCTSCHFGSEIEGGLSISYDNLLTSQTSCGAYPKYVDTANVDRSFFLVKIDHALSLQACGGRMPQGATAPNATLIGLVRKWITDGAKP